MSCDLRLDDLLALSKIYAPEYNMPELHDRVLVFDVMRDGWESSVLETPSDEFNEERSGDQPKSPTCETEHPNENFAPSSQVVSQEEKLNLEAEAEPIKAEETQSKAKPEDGSSSESETKQATEIVPSGDDESNQPSGTLVGDNESLTSSSSSTKITEESASNLLRQHKIFVHSSWLAVQSKYFRSLFFSGMKESNSKEVHVKVSESEEDTHLKLLEAVYKADILNKASVDELLAVLELADKYDVTFVFKKCKYVLQTRATTLDVCNKIMHVIKEKHNMLNVEDVVFTLQVVFGNTYSPLENNWQTEQFKKLSQPFVQYILSSRELTTQCENTVFQALMYWMENNEVDPSSLESSSKLLAAVRFEMVTIDYLYNVVRVHPIATRMPGFEELFLKGMTYHALSPTLRQLNGVAPRPRNAGNEIVQFTWTITKSSLKQTEQYGIISSEEFWCCGYKGKLNLRNARKSNSSNCPAEVFLTLLSLTRNNIVPLTWTLKSKRLVGGAVTTNYNIKCGLYSAASINLCLAQQGSYVYEFQDTEICLIAEPHNVCF